jgi:signal peptidase I
LLAVPVGLICAVDDWLLRPRRRIAADGQAAADPPVLSLAYRLLPIFVLAAVVSLILTDGIDFNAVLIAVSAVTGAVWATDARFLAGRRQAMARAAALDPGAIPEPGIVDYARSIFPVAVAVLLLRSFVFEPFRIPSDSMMPTLNEGDFILVGKFNYGLKLPVLKTKFLKTGEPKRGDVVVFHPPMDPSQTWIKRLVGLPGDHVVVSGDRLTINGHAVPFTITGPYSDGCYQHLQLATEQLGAHTHQTMLCPVPLEVTQDPLATCPRSDARGYVCGNSPPLPFADGKVFDMIVPSGEYMMMGDNRDNSDDSRFWGFVTERELIGKAIYIWFNWDLHRAGGPVWSRIGTKIG